MGLEGPTGALSHISPSGGARGNQWSVSLLGIRKLFGSDWNTDPSNGPQKEESKKFYFFQELVSLEGASARAWQSWTMNKKENFQLFLN
jgi:hypothetical protein